MPMISVSQAAKQFKVSRPTLQKALKDGNITGKKVNIGGSARWQIDTAELSRLYTLRKPDPVEVASQYSENGQPLVVEKSSENEDLAGEVDGEMKSRLEAAQAEIEALRPTRPRPSGNWQRRGRWPMSASGSWMT